MPYTETIVLTATIRPQDGVPFLQLKDEKIRLMQYLDSIDFWLNEDKVKNIIFCDNSNYSINKDKIYLKAYKMKKNVEILTFNGSERVVLCGKGFGEGEILKYVIENSEIISSVKTFYKITGRFKIKNFSEISSAHCNDNNVFRMLYSIINYKRIIRRLWQEKFKSYNFDMVDTRFFKIDKEFFKKFLMDAYLKVNDRKRYYLEHIYYEILKSHINEIKSFRIYPNFIGIGASTGKEYKGHFIDFFIKDTLTKLHLYDVK